MSARKWAPDNDKGEHAYVRDYRNGLWQRRSIVYAANLAEAKRKHGYTRERFTYIDIRRANVEDVT